MLTVLKVETLALCSLRIFKTRLNFKLSYRRHAYSCCKRSNTTIIIYRRDVKNWAFVAQTNEEYYDTTIPTCTTNCERKNTVQVFVIIVLCIYSSPVNGTCMRANSTGHSDILPISRKCPYKCSDPAYRWREDDGRRVAKLVNKLLLYWLKHADKYLL